MLSPGLNAKVDIGGNSYSSYIEDIDKESIYLATPIENGVPVMVRKKDDIKVAVHKSGAMYEFKAKVQDVYTRPLPMIKIPKPKKAKKIQRRNFFRLEKTLPVEFYVLDENGEKEISENKEAVILDISGGGVRLSTPEIIPVGSYIEITIYFDDESGESVTCVGEVVYSRNVETERVKTYHYGVSFVALPTTTQDRIVQYTFEEQRKMRKKGRFS